MYSALSLIERPCTRSADGSWLASGVGRGGSKGLPPLCSEPLLAPLRCKPPRSFGGKFELKLLFCFNSFSRLNTPDPEACDLFDGREVGDWSGRGKVFETAAADRAEVSPARAS
jgi:hypothetical protein